MFFFFSFFFSSLLLSSSVLQGRNLMADLGSFDMWVCLGTGF